MKRTMAMFLSVSSAGLIGLTGCGKEGTTGGPGANDPNKPLIGKPDNSFNITSSTVSVKAGGVAAESAIGIKRGAGFEQDVSIGFGELPKGVKIDPATPSIPKGAAEAKFNVTAAADATPGEYTVKVTGKPASGPDSYVDLKVTVKPPPTFTLNPPGNVLWSAGVKQGETKNYSISVNRDADFREDVTLKFAGLPNGVTIEPASPVAKNGEAEAKVVLKAADDATPGEYTVKVTGHPAKGADVTQDMKLTVSKK